MREITIYSRNSVKLGLEVTNLVFRDPTDDIKSAIGGLIVLPASINKLHRDRIIFQAARHRLAAVYPFPLCAASGGLVS